MGTVKNKKSVRPKATEDPKKQRSEVENRQNLQRLNDAFEVEREHPKQLMDDIGTLGETWTKYPLLQRPFMTPVFLSIASGMLANNKTRAESEMEVRLPEKQPLLRKNHRKFFAGIGCALLIGSPPAAMYAHSRFEQPPVQHVSTNTEVDR